MELYSITEFLNKILRQTIRITRAGDESHTRIIVVRGISFDTTEIIIRSYYLTEDDLLINSILDMSVNNGRLTVTTVDDVYYIDYAGPDTN